MAQAMPPLPRRHPSDRRVAHAKSALTRMIIAWVDEHELSDMEELSIITEVASSLTRMYIRDALKEERDRNAATEPQAAQQSTTDGETSGG